MVYYRKYRSQTITQLDSPKLREVLTSILSAKEVPHAFLFTGPKGLGKTSTARIIAKVLNCTGKKRDGIEPCNECEQCISITNGTNIDVLEIDGASNRGIDEIRELRERVNLAPSSAKKKVYIIDEVHMLTTEAFNALLKTIEEPPAHVVFIFCTTEPQKVPATIVSRCFHISLTRATDEELIHSLRRIVAEEKIDVDDDALSLIAHLGDGGFRDTQKLFEEVVALSKGQKITKALVEEKTQTSNLTIFITTLLASLSEKDVKKSLEVVGQLVEAGIDIKYFLQEFLQALHRVLLQKAGVVSEDSIVAGFSIDEIQTLVTLFQNAYRDTKFAVIPQLPLEIALVKWCTEKGTDVGNESSSKGKGSSSTDFAQDDKKSLKVSLNDVAKKEKNLKVQAIIKGTTSSTSSEKTEPKEEGSTYKQEDLPKDASGNALFMENIIYKVKPYNHSVAGVLRGCNIKLMDGEKIVFETPYKFHKERLEEVKTREILEKGVKEITGKNLLVMVELKQ